MADNDSGTGSALATPPNVPSSKSSDISIEEIGNEDSEVVESPPEQATSGNDDLAPQEIPISDSGDAVVEKAGNSKGVGNILLVTDERCFEASDPCKIPL